MTSGDGLTRRRFLLVGGGLLAATITGCDSSAPSSTGPSTPPLTNRSTARARTTTPVDTSPTSPVSDALPAVFAWTPNSGDVDPAVKALAVLVVQSLGTWRAGGRLPDAARVRLLDVGASDTLVHEGRALLHPARAAVVQVIEAQYGGILATSASVLVACRQWWTAADGSVTAGGTTVDVRLAKTSAGWRVTALHPARPGPPIAQPSALAQSVLTSSRIELPPAARADVLSGRVHDSVLRALLALSSSYRIGVSVVRSGHPLYVFGTTRLSDHPQGRAFDTFRIDGRLVVDPGTPRGLVTGYMEAAAAAGSYNVGGPYLLAGSGDQFFSDATHHDHVHAGFAS